MTITIDDRDEPQPEREPRCDKCGDVGCAKCNPDLALANHTAWALDQIAGA